MTHVPTVFAVMILPFKVQIVAGAAVKLTVNLEVEVAEILPVLPTLRIGAAPKLIVCAPLPTEIFCVFCAEL